MLREKIANFSLLQTTFTHGKQVWRTEAIEPHRDKMNAVQHGPALLASLAGGFPKQP